MATYMVVAVVGISLHTEVEADSPEEAKEKAMERSPTSFCHGAEMETRTEAWVTSGEIDCGDITENEIVDVELFE